MSQANEIWVRSRDVRSGRRLAMKHILESLDSTPLDDDDEDQRANYDKLNVQSFMREVPQLSEGQAVEILLAAWALYEQSKRPSESLTECTQKIQHILHILLQVYDSVGQLMQMNAMESERIVDRMGMKVEDLRGRT
eukprot:gnl/TRDRNA2_/TRDRNA2_147137_c2_seq1.p1 gnl/TRDRNA2_/TRDRNA2_147137_c2~~gnl/TRDRNA2_/TRDRNA2_147137_c2_seq1.p1  ORF type:complete len:137 (-),score=6.69 gnl/TRDRNA2_/TRDRNA2_147137_c2_seq1:36-446(-)